MKRKFITILSVCCSVMLVLTAIAGCTSPNSTSTSATTTKASTTVEPTTAEPTTAEPTEAKPTEVKNYWDLLDTVEDTSDLPDWTGNQLKLSVWMGHGPGDANHPISEHDVVSPEVKRVTGVEIDIENSFDNGGSAIDVKLGMLAAAKDWPSLIYTSDTAQIKQLVENGTLYDLTDLIPKYCPHITSLFLKNDGGTLKGINSSITDDITAKVSDRIYFVPTDGNWVLTEQYAKEQPDFDRLQWANVIPPESWSGWPRIYIRDDLLKKLYPNCMTQDEIEAAYLQNGSFTAEQIYDIPVKSTEDFYKLLTDLKALITRENIQEDGKPVDVIYANNGGDNWQVMACLFTQIYGFRNANGYFTTYDNKLGQVVYTFKQEWFKQQVIDFWKMINAGVIPKESLIDSDVIFAEKSNSGRYAITFAWTKPDEVALKAAGKTYRYRYLWPDINYTFDQFPNIWGEPGCALKMGIFKDSVAEEDLPQVLRYLDYMCSPAGTNLHYWGPRSAGLFKMENGERVYTDKDLEDNMVYAKDNQRNLYYNLYNYKVPYHSQWPSYVVWSDECWLGARYTYKNRILNANEANVAFNPGYLVGRSAQEHIVFAIKSGYMPGFSDQWTVVSKGRTAFEDALEKTLAASDEAQFAQLWQKMLDVAEQIGMNDAMLAEINKIFTEDNVNFMDAIKASK